MNNKFYILICFALLMLSCNKDNSEVAPTRQNTYVVTHAAAKDSTGASLFISTDDANKMIGSYLTSIATTADGGANTTPDVKSFTVDADQLRAYLADPNVKNVKLMFAHTMDYISAGNQGKFAGYQSGAITIIMAGYNENGDYVYHNGNFVLDHCVPCPYNCPTGAAGSDLLQ